MVVFLSSSVNYLISYVIYCTNPPCFPLNFIAKTSINLLDKKGSSPYYSINPSVSVYLSRCSVKEML